MNSKATPGLPSGGHERSHMAIKASRSYVAYRSDLEQPPEGGADPWWAY